MISLLRTPVRTREGFARLRDVQNLELVPACDGKVELENLPVPQEAALQPGEAGLCESWRRVAARIVRSGAPWALVFEDDAEPLRSLATLVADISAIPGGWDFVKLDDSAVPEPVTLREGDGFHQVAECSWVSAAMAVSLAGAVKILRGLAPFMVPIDEWLRKSGGTVWQPLPGGAYFTQSQWHPSEVRKTTLSGEIPRHIHHIWCGGSALPDEFRRYREGWVRLHPGWKFTLWGDAELHELFARCGHGMPVHLGPAGVSDIARLLILREVGGLYVDTDFECVKPFDPLIGTGSCLIADMHDGIPCNGLMASSKGHPLIARMADEVWRREGRPILEHAGPAMVKDVLDIWRSGAFTKQIRHGEQVIATALGDTGIVVINPTVLFPYYWVDQRPQVYPATAWAAHHWARSWWTETDWAAFREAQTYATV
jgi:hypothetical protein